MTEFQKFKTTLKALYEAEEVIKAEKKEISGDIKELTKRFRSAALENDKDFDFHETIKLLSTFEAERKILNARLKAAKKMLSNTIEGATEIANGQTYLSDYNEALQLIIGDEEKTEEEEEREFFGG